MQKVNRVLIKVDTDEAKAIGEALAQLKQYVNDDPSIRDCILYIPVKDHLRPSTTLAQALGVNDSESLRRSGSLAWGAGQLMVETARSFKSSRNANAVLVVYADQRMMDAVDENKALKLVICVPHAPDAVDAWADTWSPSTLEGEPCSVRLLSNKVVEAAMMSMTKTINKANSILGPSDREWVKRAFRILRAHEQRDEPAKIRSWCIRHGWPTKAADEAEKLASQAFDLRAKPSLSAVDSAGKIYEAWVSESKK